MDNIEETFAQILVLVCDWEYYISGYLPSIIVSSPTPEPIIPPKCNLLLMGISSLIYGVPAIAQDIINAVDLPVNAASLMDPTPDTITFGIDTALNIPIKTPIKTEPFTLGLFNRETKPITPWLHASFPEYTIKGFKKMVQTNKDDDILNEEEIIRTLSNAIHSKKFTLSCKGRIMAHLSALKAHLTLEKDIEMDGKIEAFYLSSIMTASILNSNLRFR